MNYKNQDFNFVNAIDENELVANMLLLGEIASSRSEGRFNGDEFAREIVFLSEIGIKTIKLNINSVGGGIVKGMSIITAMNVARMNGTSIETSVIGIADSMSGMISAFGDKGKRTVANFGSSMVHEPLAVNNDGTITTIAEMEDGPLKIEALNMLDSLVGLMCSSTGKSASEVKKTMKDSKRLNSSEMKSFGMVDKIVKLSNEVIDIENKTAVELMAACSKIEVKQKTKKMKEVKKILNLSEDAAESSVVNSILALQNKLKDNKGLLDAETLKVTKLTGENEVLVNAAKETADKNAEAYVDALINAGKLNKDNREILVNQAKENFVGFKSITDSLDVTFVDVTKEIGKKGTDAGSKDDALALKYHELRVEGTLSNFEKENPAKFIKMEEAYMNSSIDFDKV